MKQEQRECYNAALELHNHEFRTLGERSSLFVVIQSILIGGLALTITGQGVFGYIFPYTVPGISLVGAIICLIQYKSGLSGSENAFLWRQYMLSIEHDTCDAAQNNMPWNWFYNRYRGPGSLKKFPLPSVWLYTPTVFTVVWSFASAYIPIRILFDTSFAISSNRQVALIISAIIFASVVILLIFFISRLVMYHCCVNKFTREF
jgi:hypothetical protein